MAKPPKTITGEQLFKGIIGKVDKACNGKSLEKIIGESMLKQKLTPMHMDKINALNNAFTKEYENRRNMLLTRLSVTLQSFIWAGRGAEQKDKVLGTTL